MPLSLGGSLPAWGSSTCHIQGVDIFLWPTLSSTWTDFKSDSAWAGSLSGARPPVAATWSLSELISPSPAWGFQPEATVLSHHSTVGVSSAWGRGLLRKPCETCETLRNENQFAKPYEMCIWETLRNSHLRNLAKPCKTNIKLQNLYFKTGPAYGKNSLSDIIRATYQILLLTRAWTSLWHSTKNPSAVAFFTFFIFSTLEPPCCFLDFWQFREKWRQPEK